MASFGATLQPCLLETITGTDNDPTIGIAHETQGASLADAVLINLVFEKIHGFEPEGKVVVNRIVDAGIEL